MPSPAFDIDTRLSDLVETTLKQGPQVVTKNGVETAVLVSIDDWNVIRSRKSWKLPSDPAGETLKDILLDPNGPHDIYIPPRGRFKRRPPLNFDE